METKNENEQTEKLCATCITRRDEEYWYLYSDSGDQPCDVCGEKTKKLYTNIF